MLKSSRWPVERADGVEWHRNLPPAVCRNGRRFLRDFGLEIVEDRYSAGHGKLVRTFKTGES